MNTLFERASSSWVRYSSYEWKEAEDSLEKLYIAVGLMENYCHIYMHGLLDEKSLIRMRRNVISEVKGLIGV